MQIVVWLLAVCAAFARIIIRSNYNKIQELKYGQKSQELECVTERGDKGRRVDEQATNEIIKQMLPHYRTLTPLRIQIYEMLINFIGR